MSTAWSTPSNGYFVDQRWMDLVPGLYPEMVLLRDPGYNLAYWNLPARTLRLEEDVYTVDGRPLRFFHFSGFDPLTPHELSKHQNRLKVGSNPALEGICGEYAERVLARGYEEAREWPYGWNELPGGLRLDDQSRRLYRRARDDGKVKGSVFTRRGEKQLVSYLNHADEKAPPGSGVTRYLAELHRSRSDLQRAFPDLRGADAARYVAWAQNNDDPSGVQPALRPPAGAAAERNGSRGANGAGINLAGYLSSELGVGEAARQMGAAIEEVGIETARIDIPVDAAEMPGALARLDGFTPHPVNLICVNADMVEPFAGAVDPSFLPRSVLDRDVVLGVGLVPRALAELLRASRRGLGRDQYTADGIRPVATVPVETIRLPVTPTPPAETDRGALGLPDGFCFLFVFDYRSVFRRKNPLGVVDAFSRAFGADEDASLVIKTVGSEAHPEGRAAARRGRATRGDSPDRGEGERRGEERDDRVLRLLRLAPSLGGVRAHPRGGDVLREARDRDELLGQPRLHDRGQQLSGPARDHRGRRRRRPIPVRRALGGAGPRRGGEADGRAKQDHREAEERGRRAAADIRRTHSPRAAGEVISERISAVAANGHGSGDTSLVRVPREIERPAPDAVSPGGSEGIEELRHLLAFDEPPARPDAGPIRRAAKRAYLRLLRPYASYQQRVNASTAKAMDETRVALSRDAAAIERREAAERRALDARVGEISAAVERMLEDSEAQREESKAQREEAGERARAIERRIDELASTVGTSAGAQAAIEEALQAGDRELARKITVRTREVRASVMERLLELRRSAEESEREAEAALEALQREANESVERLRAEFGAEIRTAREDAGAASEEARSVRAEAQAAREKALEAMGEIDTQRESLSESVERLRAEFGAEMRTAREDAGAAREEAGSVRAEAQAAREKALEAMGEIDTQRESLSDLRRDADRLVAAVDATPYMSGTPFTELAEGPLGTVLGFTEPPGEEPASAYLGFEEVFRGSEESIRDRQAVYIELARGFAPVLDLGCGRGELLDLLADAGIEAAGVDSDPGMVARCREKGHDQVTEADAVEHLASLDARSLGTIFSAQVVEHLTYPELQRILDLSLDALRPGGRFIAETVNPHSPMALKAFWVDPTHRAPLFPETMLALCRLAGFASAFVFCPIGSGDYERDRKTEGEYAVVARAPEGLVKPPRQA